MEQSSQQSNNAHASIVQNPLPADYWNNIESLYPQQPHQPTQHQHQQQQQHQQQTPQGITWDHPIFAQRGQQQQQQPPLPQPQEHVRDLYSGTPQSWAQTPSPAPQSTNIPQPQAYGLSHQHPYQMQQYPQDQLAYEPQALASGELSYASSYSLPGQYYQPAGLQPSDAYPQTQHRSIAPRPPTAQQHQLNAASQQNTQPHNQYILPAPNYAENVQGGPHFTQFAEPTPALNYQNTIDPRFLSSGQPGTDQTATGQSPFLFYNPTASSYERPNDPKAYQIFPDNLATLNAEQLNARDHIHPQFAQFPELAPYPISTGDLGMSPSSSICEYLFTLPAVPPESEKISAALAKNKTGTTKSKPQKASAKGPKKADNRSVSESETESSDSDLEVEEPEEPSPLPPARPTDADGAAQYDSIKAVWSPRNRRPKAEKIKASLVAFKDVVKAVRDEWKTLSQAMKDAENQNANEKAAELRKKVVQERQIMNVVVSTTLDKGHEIIIEKLGEHPMAVAALYSFLLDRHQASDYEGVLLVNILKLLARFTTMDEDTLSKTNVSKLLPRIIKKGIQPGKDLAQKILDNAAASTKRKQESAAANSPSKDGTPDRASESSRSESVTGIKRPRDGESNGLPATKKAVASSATKGPVAAKTAGASTVKPADGKPAAPAARAKANIAPPKPTSLFGSLASASKKPGTSNAARAAAAAAAAKEKANAPAEKPAPAPAPAKPAFSFGDLLADLNKKEDTKAPKTTETLPPETEEEREKRLRKEERRKLRVSWKPESSLVEVRLFTHDPDEEIGADDDLKRDVADIKGEGRMLKLHKDLDLDDEEESGPQEEEFSPWTRLVAIEMDSLSSEDQENNFIKRGGSKEPESPEKLAQETREANTLMVFYTSPADVPPSPKEPPEPTEEEEPSTEQSFGEPDDNVKGRSARYFAMVNPTPPPKPAAPIPAAAPTNGPVDLTNLLKVIQPGPQQAQSTPPPQPAQPQPAPLSELERTINIFRQQQGQPQIVPPAPAQPFDFQKILAVLNAQKQLGAQPQPPAQLPVQLPPSQPNIAPNLAAIVSQLGGNNATPPVSQPPSQYSGHYEDPERKRLRDSGRGYENNGFGQGNAKRPRMYVDPEAKKHPRAGSVPCRFWRENKCLKGDDCTFRHDPADLD
ncbi:hypothetical protein PISL3812_05432 [Talaromyces islandicus]|uniref:C3H1-type domain-containing protein n=1 Tax=Talaromyces islandicus TaxID=28573 RepID=A0A0U1LZ71_TALIS|nr:hypothetical protein PISL3812_05432 [Talaromyces islandicus]